MRIVKKQFQTTEQTQTQTSRVWEGCQLSAITRTQRDLAKAPFGAEPVFFTPHPVRPLPGRSLPSQADETADIQSQHQCAPATKLTEEVEINKRKDRVSAASKSTPAQSSDTSAKESDPSALFHMILFALKVNKEHFSLSEIAKYSYY